jgi:hypothetical protein
LVPGGEAFGVAFCPAFTDEPRKRNPGHDLKYVAEQTCAKLHGRDSFAVSGGFSLLSPFYFGESFCYCSIRKAILDKNEAITEISECAVGGCLEEVEAAEEA